MIITNIQTRQKISKEKLMNAISFSEADLAVNEGLRFSVSQQLMVKPKIELYIALSVIGAFVCFCFAFILFLIGQNPAGFLFLALILSVAGFGVCFYGIFWSLGISNRVKKGYGVKKVEGIAELKINYVGENNDTPVYTLIIDGVKFSLTEAMFDAFNEENFRVYYFPLVKNIILSAEPMD